MFDILIRGGLLVDGTGGPARPADVGVEGDRIVAIGNLQNAEAARVVDASGLVVAPGFIDIHTHSDLTLLVDPRELSKVKQGVTTDVVGNCGSTPWPVSDERKELQRAQMGRNDVEWDWTDLKGYRDAHHRQGIGMNIAPLAGHSELRAVVIGYEDRSATPDEIKAMQRLTAEAMEQGAFGLSAGLTLPPGAYADTDEIVALCQAMAAYPGRFYASHSRVWAGNYAGGIAEAVEIGRRGGVPVQVAHLGIHEPKHWGKSVDILADVIDKGVADGVDVTIDTYPYTASSSPFTQFFPTWAQSGGRQALAARIRDPKTGAQIRRELETKGPFGGWPWLWDKILIAAAQHPEVRQFEGKSIQQAADALGMEPLDTALKLMDLDDAYMKMVYFYRNEDDMRNFLRHPRCMVGSDGSAIVAEGKLGEGKPHPRYYGAATRILGRYVREYKVLTLEQAVYKMSGQPADRLGLKDRGRLAIGQAADIAVFDPATVIDRADYQNPHQYADGVPYVLVNGKLTLDRGEHTGVRAGRVLEPK